MLPKTSNIFQSIKNKYHSHHISVGETILCGLSTIAQVPVTVTIQF